MGYLYDIIDGKQVNSAAAVDFHRMNRDFNARFGLWLIVSDGVRSYAVQAAGYSDYVNGRTSVRWANPDSIYAYHVETNPTGPRAIDIRDTGEDAGVTRYGNERSAWIRDNAMNYNWQPRGYWEFDEPWHLEWQGTLATDGNWAGGGGGEYVPLTLTVDGILGGDTIRKLQSVVGARPDGDMGYETITKLQARLGVKQDGELGPQTISELQRRVGLTGTDIDGDWGKHTTSFLQAHLNNGGDLSGTAPTAPSTTAPGKLTVDGQLGQLTIKRLQESLGVAQDGDWGAITTSALQKAIGALVDGVLGPQTIKGLQANVGADQDGSMGPQTVTKLQEFLNSGQPWKQVAVTPEAPVSGFEVTPRVPLLPFAVAGWNVPLGQGKRKYGKLTTYIVHHETAFTSQVPYFKVKNSRDSCPTWEVDGKIVTEMIHPAMRPSATGAANEYSVASETVNTGGEPDWKVSQDSLESHAQIAAWLSQQDFITTPDGDIVDCREFKLDREHVIGHKEAKINATRCPGEFQMEHMGWIVARAIEIAAEGPVVLPPTKPPVVVPPVVPSSLGQQIAESYRELGDLLEKLPAGV